MFRAYTEEELQIQKMVRAFMENEISPNIDKWEETSAIPKTIFKKLSELGVVGSMIPEEYDGAGLDMQSNVIIAEEIGRVYRSLGFVFIHNMVLGIIFRHGTEEQKYKYLKPMIEGDLLACFCLTEPDCGSDAGAIKTRATKQKDNYILNGTKNYITNGDVADVYLVAAKTNPEAKSKGISLFIIDKGTKGLSVPKSEKKLGMNGTNICEVVINDCTVPAENLLGNIENKGFFMLMDGLESGRVTNGALSVGMAQGAYEIAFDYARKREAFGKYIADFQAIQFMLVDMVTEIEAARLLVAKAAWYKDHNLRASKYISMAKRLAADTAMKVATDAVQILGGYGYVKDYKAELFMRDAKGGQIVEGTSQIQRVIVFNELMKESS